MVMRLTPRQLRGFILGARTLEQLEETDRAGCRLLVDRIVAQGWPVAVGDRGTSPCHLIGLARIRPDAW